MMQRSTVILFLAAAFFLVPATLSGQRMMRTPEERAKLLKARLSLSDEQTKEVRKIFDDAQDEFQKAMGEHMGDRDAMRKAMTDINAKNDKKIEKILTDDQKKEYEKVKKERSQMRRRGPGS